MKKSELLEMIRTVVKEEVDHMLPQLLMEVLAEKITQNTAALSESKSVPASHAINSTIKKPTLVAFEESIKRSPVQVPRTYSKNPALNAVLNETVGGIPQDGVGVVMPSVPSVIDVLKNVPTEVLNENKDVMAIANAMNRNYSQMLKSVDAKAKAIIPA